MKKNILLTAAALLTTLAGAAQWQPAGDRIGKRRSRRFRKRAGKHRNADTYRASHNRGHCLRRRIGRAV